MKLGDQITIDKYGADAIWFTVSYGKVLSDGKRLRKKAKMTRRGIVTGKVTPENVGEQCFDALWNFNVKLKVMMRMIDPKFIDFSRKREKSMYRRIVL
jgi:hypothetical protein